MQLRVLYGESAQYKLGQGRGRFDDKAIRVGPAYQAVIPRVKTASYNFAAEYCSSQDFLRATSGGQRDSGGSRDSGGIGTAGAAGAAMSLKECGVCATFSYWNSVVGLPAVFCSMVGDDGHLPPGPGAKQVVRCPKCKTGTSCA